MIEKVKSILPKEVYDQLSDTCIKFNINNELRLIHFLAQCDHESGGFKIVKENLNYSEAGLLKTFPKYFNSITAKEYAHQPEKIANKVYANRMGNSNEESGNGYRYSGRGYIQLTGKNNYKAFNKFVKDDILISPSLIATKYPLMSAAWFFDNNNIWKICDQGSSVEVITKVSKIVNGGTNGLDERIKLFNKYYKIINK